MNAVVEALISEVLVREGWPRYSDDPADRGGPTKGGITQAALAEHRGHPVTPADVGALQEPEARDVYRQRYIYKWKFEQIPDDWVQEFVIDMGVLQGQETAAQVLQRVLDVPADGDIGPVTLASLQMALHRPARLRKALIRARTHALLDAMVSEIPREVRQTTNLKWRHGWWNRVCDFIGD